jgi:hypothetical protein
MDGWMNFIPMKLSEKNRIRIEFRASLPTATIHTILDEV